MNYEKHLAFAEAFIAKSRRLILELWQEADLELELKSDRTPVTKLDRQVESMFREDVARVFPDHAALGEEYGLSGAEGEFVWVIDPIDGTQSLVNRVPTFGTFLALVHNGTPVVGIIDVPVLGRCVTGAVGAGVRDERGRPIDLSADRPVTPNDIVAIGTSGSFARGGDSAVQARMLEQFASARVYYDSFGHYLVALGGVGGLLEMNVPSWDVVAVEALVNAAGGTVHYVKKAASLTGLRSSIVGRRAVVEAIRAVVEG